MAGFSATQRIFATMALTPEAYKSGLVHDQDSHGLRYPCVDFAVAPEYTA